MPHPEYDNSAGDVPSDSHDGDPGWAAEDVQQFLAGNVNRPASPVINETDLGSMTVSRLHCAIGSCPVRFLIRHDGNWGDPQLQLSRSAGTCILSPPNRRS